MLSVEEATAIILNQKRDFGIESLPFMQARGRVLATPIVADRDLPPFNRVAMDGIAIRFEDYEAGARSFYVHGTVAAGEAGPNELPPNHCIEIMTGAALPATADTVIPYEQIQLTDGQAIVQAAQVRQGQNIHFQAADKAAGAILVPADCVISPIEMSVAAATGNTLLQVKKLPSVAIFSSGNELVEADETPTPFQIRRSNNYAVQAELQGYGIEAQIFHLRDDKEMITAALQKAVHNFDVLILSGGISAGKFDYIPEALEQAGVKKLFHQVRQKPGKPFWFGIHEKTAVFALPGNPVSTLVCLLRYVKPWLEASLGIERPVEQAALSRDLQFEPRLQWFVPVKLQQGAHAEWLATPVTNRGSGDYASLLEANGFLELRSDQHTFKTGEVFPVWRWFHR